MKEDDSREYMLYPKKEAIKRYKEVSLRVNKRIKAQKSIRRIRDTLKARKTGREYLPLPAPPINPVIAHINPPNTQEDKRKEEDNLLLNFQLEGLLTLEKEEEPLRNREKSLPPKKHERRRSTRLTYESEEETESLEESEESLSSLDSLSSLEPEEELFQASPHPETQAITHLPPIQLNAQDTSSNHHMPSSMPSVFTNEDTSGSSPPTRPLLFNPKGIERVTERRKK